MTEGDGTAKKSNEELAQMHTESAKQKLADSLNDLDECLERLAFVFDLMPDWNNNILYRLKEAGADLGFGLATLFNWDKED